MGLQLPSWLQVQPSDFSKAAAEGMAAGARGFAGAQEAASAMLSANAKAQQASRGAARGNMAAVQGANMAQKRLDQEMEMAKMNSAMRQKQMDQQNQVQQQQIEVQQAYHDQQASLAKQKLQQAADISGKKYMAQMKLSSLLQQGVPFDKAITQVPEFLQGAVLSDMTKSATAQQKINPLDMTDYKQASTRYAKAQEKLNSGDPTTDPTALRKEMLNAKWQMDSIKQKVQQGQQQGQGAPGATSTATSQAAPKGTHKDGNGNVWQYTGSGDWKKDRDPKNWQQINQPADQGQQPADQAQASDNAGGAPAADQEQEAAPAPEGEEE